MDADQFLAEVKAEIGQRAELSAGHPSDDLLQAYVTGELGERGRRVVGAHLASCAACAEQAEVLRAEFDELESLLEPELPEPATPRATPSRARPSWMETVWAMLEQLTMPRRLVGHAATYVLVGAGLYVLNRWLNARFGPEPAPLGAPEPAPWWAEWWAPYVLGAWGVLVVLHLGWTLWRRYRHRRDRK